MQRVFDEGITQYNNRPLAVECLLMSSGRSTKLPDWERMHYHKYIELLYVVSGHYEAYISGSTVDMPARSMAIVNEGELHTTRTLDTSNTLLCIKFIPQILYSSEQTISELEHSLPYVFEHLSQPRCFFKEELAGTPVPDAFRRIQKEHKNREFGYELAIRAEVLRIVSWVMRRWYDSAQNKDIPQDPGAAEIVAHARQYVREHLTDATLSGAADYCGLSYSYLSRVFNRYMKMSFSGYVNLERINHSMRQLSMTDMSVTEIALSLGFSSTSYYIQTFRRLKSISPMQFRKTFKQPAQP
ncbi:MAG: helix-turn-helix domain-containing protein [Clostridia bacterium]|nr:helix-turn-helix domain-containing protein [Clostridia bacterium]MBQ7002923.1 helix-turn-helix domain-containing protein [Oscillospiraceae bacterium]